MGEYRRRRIEPDEPKGGGGLPIFPLIVLVIFAGLLLGGGLAKFLGRGGTPQPAAPAFTPLPTQAPTQSPLALRTPKATPSPKATMLAKASPSATPSSTPLSTPSQPPSPTASATPTASPKATETPKPKATPALLIITPSPKPAAKPTTKPAPEPTAKPTPSPTPAPALITGAATADHAASIVRSYLAALANGESSFATGYLRRGLPTEDFMKGGRVTSVQATPNGDGSFFVTAAMQTPGGAYTENFRVENGPQGLQITDHTPSVSH